MKDLYNKIKNIKIKGSLFFTIIALVTVVYGALSIKIMNNSMSIIDANGVDIQMPTQVLLGAPSGWEQYRGAAVYNWDDFRIEIYNDSPYQMTDISLDLTGTGTLIGEDNGEENFHVNNLPTTLDPDDYRTVRGHGVIKNADNWTDTDETLTISYKLNGVSYSASQTVHFYSYKSVKYSDLPQPTAVAGEYKYYFGEGDFDVRIERTNIYLDKSESLDNLGISLKYRSWFNSTVKVEHPQSNNTDNHFSGSQPRLKDYFYISSKPGSGSVREITRDGNWQDIGHILRGDYATQTTNGVTEIKVPVIGTYSKGWWSKSTYDSEFSVVSEPVVNVSIYDKSGLYELIYEAQANIDKYNSEYYNTTTYQEYINDAVEVYGNRVTTQPEIDAIKTNLNAAKVAIPSEKDANYSDLGAALTGLTSDLYTPETWALFETTYNESVDIYENRPYKKKDQREIEKQIKKLNADKTVLVYKDADYSQLQTAITNAEALRDHQEIIRGVLTYIYTDTTRDALTAKINEVVWGLNITEQSRVDGWKTAIESYELEEKLANYDLVNNAVNAARIKEITTYGGQTLYTEESIADAESAIALVVGGKKITSQAEVDGWADIINDVVWIKKGADYTAVNAAKAEAIAERNRKVSVRGENVDVYTPESQADFDTEMANVIDNLPLDEQTTVDGFVQVIANARALLVEKDADYSEIDTVIGTVTDEITLKYKEEYIYTPESITRVTTAINAVVRNLKIDRQDDIDGWKQDILTAYGQRQKKPANYDVVNNAIAAANAKMTYTVDVGGEQVLYYTQETIDALNAYITNNVDRTHTIGEEDEVIAIATRINEESNKLTPKKASYTEIDNYITTVRAEMNRKLDDKYIYTLDSREAVEDAIGLIIRNLNIDSQNQITTWQAGIQTAYEAREENPANYDELDDLIIAASNKKDRKVDVRGEQVYLYTTETRNNLQSVINNIERDKTMGQQADVDGYVTAVTAAMEALVPKNASYTDINVSINIATTEINKKFREQLIYTETTIGAVQTAMSAVVSNLTIDHQNEIDAWKAAIDEAVENLIVKNADYSAVTAAKNAAELARDRQETIRGEEVYVYTDDSRQAVTAAINNVIEGLDILAQDQVDGFVSPINTAAGNLIEKDASYDLVTAAITNAQTEIAKKVGNKHLYTEASINVVTAAIDDVEEGRKITAQAEVDGWATAINTAIGQLKKAPADYDAYDDAVREFRHSEPYINGWYDDDAKDELDSYANLIPRNIPIDEQGTVNAYLEEFARRLAVLPLKPADYSEVDAIVEEYHEREAYVKEWYSEETQKPLDEYIESYDKEITINRQAEITIIKNRLNELISALEYAEADYSKVDAIVREFREGKAYKNNWYINPEIVDEYINAYDKTIKKNNQEQVDDIETELKRRLNLLEYKPADYSEADAVEEEAEEISNTMTNGKELYTKASYNALLQAIASYKELPRDLTRKNQDDIDNNMHAILKAEENLEKNPADYSKINELVAKINKLNKADYKNFNIVEEQLKNIVYGKKIDEQNLVDYMYEILKKAYDKLEKAPKKEQSKNNKDYYEEESVIVEIKINGNVVDLTKQPFRQTVVANVNTADIRVTLTDEELGYKINGNDKLTVGENEFTITIDGKEYKLIITREESNDLLKTLKIKGYKINFKKNKKNYKIKIGRGVKKLKLDAIPEDKEAKVTILGNKNLVDGSTVKIIVKGQDEREEVYALEISKKKAGIIPAIVGGTAAVILLGTGIFIRRKY